MDALTSFELEAQRRRETIAGDRDHRIGLATADAEAARATIIEPAVVRHRDALIRTSGLGDCQPGPMARQSVG